MTMEENKALISRFIDGIITGDETVWDELCAPEFVMHVNMMDTMTLEQSKQYSKANRVSFPDVVYTIEDIIAESDMIALRYTMQGTHQGPFRGIPPTGKKITMVAFEIVRISNRKFVETWFCMDFASLMAQLGDVPAPPKW